VVRPRGAQVARTTGVSEMPDSSSKMIQALWRLALHRGPNPSAVAHRRRPSASQTNGPTWMPSFRIALAAPDEPRPRRVAHPDHLSCSQPPTPRSNFGHPQVRITPVKGAGSDNSQVGTSGPCTTRRLCSVSRLLYWRDTAIEQEGTS
jgi:hypothetical protein